MQNEGTELIHLTVGSEWDFSQEPPGHWGFLLGVQEEV